MAVPEAARVIVTGNDDAELNINVVEVAPPFSSIVAVLLPKLTVGGSSLSKMVIVFCCVPASTALLT